MLRFFAAFAWLLFTLSISAFSSPRVQPRNFDRPHLKSQMIVGLKVHRADSQLFFSKFKLKQIHKFSSSEAFLLEVFDDAGETLIQLANRIAEDEAISYVEANTIIKLNLSPNDPKYGELYGLNNTGVNNGIEDADIDAPEAWETQTGSKSVLVAIIDTGINHAHPDLAPNIWVNPGESGIDEQGNDKRSNGIDDDHNGFVDDWRGWDFVNNDNNPMDDNGYNHGSHCAGTIGAKGNDGFGVVGVNWNVSLVGVKFLSAAGSGSLADAIKSVEYANLIGADIQSNSWGGGGFSQALYDAILSAKEKDILFVAAGGNESANTDENAHYPSAYDLPNILSVAATDRRDVIAGFSNFGIQTVDVAAPGVDILSVSSNSDFRVLSGTSMATPHVAGAAALIKASFPGLAYDKIIARIINGAERIEGLKGLVASGARLNVASAIEVDNIVPSAVELIQQVDAGFQDLSLSWSPSGDDGDTGRASQYVIRMSSHEILDEQDWNDAIEMDYVSIGDENHPAGRVEGLSFNFSGYFAIRAVDNVGNLGELGNSFRGKVTEIQEIYRNDAVNLDAVETTGPWAIETLEGLHKECFSDSPRSFYENDLDIVLKLPFIELKTPVANDGVFLAYITMTDLEKGYDFGHVELSLDDGQNWAEIDLITGTKKWHTRLVDLSPWLNQSHKIRLRFRMSTDYVIQGDGWLIDSVSLISAVSQANK